MAENNKKKKKNRILGYFKDVKGELKKVVWPSFKQVKNNTLIVIACVLIIGAFIWILDYALTLSLGKVIEKTQGVQTEQTQVQDGTAVSQDELTEEQLAELQKTYMESLAAVGVSYNEETQKFTDTETGAELTDEDVQKRLEALNTTDSDAEGTANPEASTDAEQ